MENNLRTLPLLPLKNSVLFPGLVMPLSVGRAASMGAVEKALSTEDKEIVVVAQRDPSVDSPGAEDLFTLGTRAVIKKVARPNSSQIDVLVLGVERVVIVKVDDAEGYMTARLRSLPMPDDSSGET